MKPILIFHRVSTLSLYNTQVIYIIKNNILIESTLFLFIATFDDDFYISSSSQPFETNQSQFFPGQKSHDIDDIFEPHASDLNPLKLQNACMFNLTL